MPHRILTCLRSFLWASSAPRAGGHDNGAPGLRPIYGPDYYAAFIIDPSRINRSAGRDRARRGGASGFRHCDRIPVRAVFGAVCREPAQRPRPGYRGPRLRAVGDGFLSHRPATRQGLLMSYTEEAVTPVAWPPL